MPNIIHLADHTCVIWHKAETLGDHRETVKSFPTFDGPIQCKANRKNAVVALRGGGIIQRGERKVYFDPGPTWRKRDLVELVTGPDAPALLEIESGSTPRGHHVELRCSEYEGPEPELGS